MLHPLTAIPSRQELDNTFLALRRWVHRTPVLTSQTLNSWLDAEVFFKCENFQKVGAFKYRGACSAVFRLSEKEKKQGVATHSSGNHAQAVARAAKENGIKAYIVMPKGAPEVKRKATEGYGAEIILCENTLQSREETLAQVIERTGATLIHPYNSYDVIAGQATASMELLQDEDLDFLLTPIGGGGLISGACLAAEYFAPQTKVIGCEPHEVDDAYRSIKSGKLCSNTTTNTIGDGLRTNLGEKGFEFMRSRLHDVLLCEEKEIIEATQWLWERMKIVVEPSSAVPLACLMKNKELFKGKRIGVILTGGNVVAKDLVRNFD